MQLTFDHVKLRQALKRVAPAINNKTILPVLENVLLSVNNQTATFTATDLHCFLVTECECTTANSGDVLLPYDELSRIAAVLNGPVTITITGKQAHITSGKDVFKLSIEQQMDLFPKVPVLEPVASFELDNTLIDLISKMALITKNDAVDNRLEHVCFDCSAERPVIIYACDGFRGVRHITTIETPANIKLPLHKTHARMLREIGACTFSFSDKWTKAAGVSVTAYLLNGDINYPESNILYNTHNGFNVELRKDELEAAIDKVMVYRSDYHKINLRFAESEAVAVNFLDAERGYELKTDLSAKQNLEPVSKSINAGLLKDLLTCLPPDAELELNVTPAAKPLYIGSKTNAETLCVLMPMMD